jgi:hypothetical protein
MIKRKQVRRHNKRLDLYRCNRLYPIALTGQSGGSGKVFNSRNHAPRNMISADYAGDFVSCVPAASGAGIIANGPKEAA